MSQPSGNVRGSVKVADIMRTCVRYQGRERRMGGAQQTQLTGWHLKIRDWLQNVINHQQRMFYAEFRRAAAENQGSFPKAILPVIAAHLYKPFAVWLVKSAL